MVKFLGSVAPDASAAERHSSVVSSCTLFCARDLWRLSLPLISISGKSGAKVKFTAIHLEQNSSLKLMLRKGC